MATERLIVINFGDIPVLLENSSTAARSRSYELIETTLVFFYL